MIVNIVTIEHECFTLQHHQRQMREDIPRPLHRRHDIIGMSMTGSTNIQKVNVRTIQCIKKMIAICNTGAHVRLEERKTDSSSAT